MNGKKKKSVTREKIKNMEDKCRFRAGHRICKWRCSSCRLSDKYEKFVGERIEVVNNDY